MDQLQRDVERLLSLKEEQTKKNEAFKKAIAKLQLERPKDPYDYERIHFNDALVWKEMARRGIQLSFISDTQFVQATLGRHQELLIHGVISNLIPYVDAVLLENKLYEKQWFEQNGYPVLKGQTFLPHEREKALLFAKEKLGYPVVIKPVKGSGGSFVFCDIRADEDLMKAYATLAEVSLQPLLLEEFWEGAHDYRFFLIQGKVLSVIRRTPPSVIGDGTSTLLQLIEKENDRRMNPRRNCLCPIQVDVHCIKNQGFELEHVIAQGTSVLCRLNANVSMGADCETCREEIHPSYFERISCLMKLFPRLPLLTVDCLIRNPSLPATNENFRICEASCINPGLSLHTHPSKGMGDDIISPLVDLFFPETAHE